MIGRQRKRTKRQKGGRSVSWHICLTYVIPFVFMPKRGGAGDETDERFAEIMQSAFRTEEIENRGMRVLRVYLKPTPELKSYLSSFAHFDRYHFDCYERFAPYVSFADIVFLQNGIPLLNCLTHEGYFDVHESIRDVFAGFEKD